MCPEGKGPPFAYVVKALTPPVMMMERGMLRGLEARAERSVR